MNDFLKHGLRFLFAVLVQVLILNQMEIGFGIQLMVYPLFILLLPVEINVITLMLISFLMGIAIDSFSNTFGLHTSAILVLAYTRPMIYSLFSPRDGYDTLVETNVFTMGFGWFIRTAGSLIFIHHFWFFMLEMFKMNEILFVLQKTVLSAPISFLICILLQYLFVKKSNKNEL